MPVSFTQLYRRFTIFSLYFLAYFYTLFGLFIAVITVPVPAQRMHILLLALLAISLSLLVTAISALPLPNTPRWTSVYASGATVLLLSLPAFYGANILAKRLWGQYMNQSIIAEYARQPSYFTSFLPVSPLNNLVIFAAAFAIACLIFIAIRKLFVWIWLFESTGAVSMTSALIAFLLLLVNVFLPHYANAADQLWVLICAAIGSYLVVRYLDSQKSSTFNTVDSWATLALSTCTAVFLLIAFATVHNAYKALQAGPTRFLLAQEPFTAYQGVYTSDTLSPYKQQIEIQDATARQAYQQTVPDSGTLQNSPNIVLILVDTLRADHLSMYGYHRDTTPYLTTLFEEDKLQHVDLALSTCNISECSILSTLTSKPYQTIGAQNFNILALLSDAGYDINVLLSGSHTNWYGLSNVFNADIDFLYSTATESSVSNDDLLLLDGLQQLPNYANKPNFFYVHLMSAHGGTKRHAQFQTFQPSNLTIDFRDFSTDPFTLVNYYDNGIVQADYLVQETMETLAAKGYLENAIVIIASDHGELVDDTTFPVHGKTLVQAELHIPILVYTTPFRALQNTDYATSLDIAPTLIDFANLPAPETWHGMSLFTDDHPRYTFHQSQIPPLQYAVVRWEEERVMKYIYSATGTEFLFELISDPHEQHNLISSDAHAAILQDLRTQHADYLALDPLTAP